MTTGPHRVRIDFNVNADTPTTDSFFKPFFDLERAIKARLTETGAGSDAFYEHSFGGLIEMSCADADTCYDAIEDLLLASPLAEGATAVLIYGDEEDAEQNEFPVGTPKE